MTLHNVGGTHWGQLVEALNKKNIKVPQGRGKSASSQPSDSKLQYKLLRGSPPCPPALQMCGHASLYN